MTVLTGSLKSRKQGTIGNIGTASGNTLGGSLRNPVNTVLSGSVESGEEQNLDGSIQTGSTEFDGSAGVDVSNNTLDGSLQNPVGANLSGTIDAGEEQNLEGSMQGGEEQNLEGSIQGGSTGLEGSVGIEGAGETSVRLLREWDGVWTEFYALSAKLGVELNERLKALTQMILEMINVEECHMNIDLGGDGLLAIGETKTVTCKVYSPIYRDITEYVSRWQIERVSTDRISDQAWGAKDKVKAFNSLRFVNKAQINLTWSNDLSENDLDPDQSVSGTKFIITAWVDKQSIPVVAELEV